jgi:hypothetical protein
MNNGPFFTTLTFVKAFQTACVFYFSMISEEPDNESKQAYSWRITFIRHFLVNCPKRAVLLVYGGQPEKKLITKGFVIEIKEELQHKESGDGKSFVNFSTPFSTLLYK